MFSAFLIVKPSCLSNITFSLWFQLSVIQQFEVASRLQLDWSELVPSNLVASCGGWAIRPSVKVSCTLLPVEDDPSPQIYLGEKILSTLMYVFLHLSVTLVASHTNISSAECRLGFRKHAFHLPINKNNGPKCSGLPGTTCISLGTDPQLALVVTASLRRGRLAPTEGLFLGVSWRYWVSANLHQHSARGLSRNEKQV